MLTYTYPYNFVVEFPEILYKIFPECRSNRFLCKIQKELQVKGKKKPKYSFMDVTIFIKAKFLFIYFFSINV